MKKAVLFCLWCVSLYAVPAYAKDIVVHALKMPPLIIDPQNGIVVDRVKEVMACSKLNHTVSIKPWARSFNETKERGGALIPTMMTEERKAFFWYPEHPVYEVTYHFFSRRNSGFKWTGDYTDVKGLKIAKLRGGAVDKEFDQLAKEGYFDLYEATSFDQMRTMVLRGRVDLIAADKNTIEYLCACDVAEHDEVETIDGPPIAIRKIYIAFNKNELTVEEKMQVNACHASFAPEPRTPS